MRSVCTHLLEYALLVCACVFLTRCDDHISSRNGNPSNEIHFSPKISGNSKAIYSSNDNISSVGIFAFYTEASNFVWANRSPNFMNNQLVRRVGTSSWIYTPTRYWPAATSDKLSFFAYSPHSSAFESTDGLIRLDTLATDPALFVTLPSRQRQQADVLVGTPMLNTNSGNVENGLIPLSFNHTLASLDFYAQTAEGTLDITSVKLYYTSTVKRSGKVSLSTGTWISGTLQNSYATIDGTTGSRKDTLVSEPIEVTTETVALTSSDSHVLLIPQTLSAGNIKMEISYTMNGTDKVKTLSLPAQTYEAGHNYPFLFEFTGTDLVFAIALPTVATNTQDMCGCTYDRETNPTHNLSLPHYSASSNKSNWKLRANADWTSTFKWNRSQNFYIYGRYTVTSWTTSGTPGTLYVMPGGVLDLRNVSTMTSGMKIVNFGSVILPNTFTISSGATFTSVTDLDASSTALTVKGSLVLYEPASFNSIVANNSASRISAYKCLNTNSLSMSSSSIAYIYSYLETSALSMINSCKLYLYNQSYVNLNGNYTLSSSYTNQIINNDTGYAVFKCNTFILSFVSSTTNRITGRIDIKGTIQSTYTNPSWNSLVLRNGSTTITADGCKPAYP